MIYIEGAGYLVDIQDLHIIQSYNSGEDELVFAIRKKHSLYSLLCEETELKYNGQHYVVKSIDEQAESAEISCQLNIDGLKAYAVIDYRQTDQNLTTLLNFALTGSGWTHEGAGRVTIRRTTELEAGNGLDLLRLAEKNYSVVLRYDTARKVVNVIPLTSYEYKGTYFTEELNIKEIFLRGDTFEFCTRLIPIGAEGMRIDDINGGKSYVENYEYCNKAITRVWKDERYTDKQSMRDDAIEKLKILSKPNRTYSVDVIDLAAVNSEYSALRFDVGDKVAVIDRNRGIRAEHQVVKLETYPDEPQRNHAELAATAEGFESIVQNITGMIEGTNTVVNLHGRRISKMTLDIEAFTVELGKYYTKGETETYVSSQIQAESERINLVVSEQQTTIDNMQLTQNSQGSQISLLSDKLEIEVREHQTAIDGLTATQTEQSSQISLLSTGMELKVSKDNVISSINLSPESVVISARKIQLDGEILTNNTFNWLNGNNVLYGSIFASDAGVGNFNPGLVIDSQKAITLQGSHSNPGGAADSIRLIADYGDFRAWANNGKMRLYGRDGIYLDSRTYVVGEIDSDISISSGGFAIEGYSGNIFGNLYSRKYKDAGNNFYKVALCESSYMITLGFDGDSFMMSAYDSSGRHIQTRYFG